MSAGSRRTRSPENTEDVVLRILSCVFNGYLDGDDEMPSLDGQTPARDVAVSGSALCVDGAICEIRGAAKQVL